MPESMDVVGSLKKVSRELAEAVGEPGNPSKTVDTLEAASFLIAWIADGLDQELQYAAERGRKLKENTDFGLPTSFRPDPPLSKTLRPGDNILKEEI